MIETCVLGTAAGGGFPQWNCFCPNCRAARSGHPSAPPQLQSSLAVRVAGGPWHLVNASPDVATQITRFLCDSIPDSSAPRQSPVGSVFLTNADLDHCLGLFALREGPEIRVVAPDGVRQSLMRGLNLDTVLGAFSGVRWGFASSEWFPADAFGLEARAVPLEGATPPRFDPAEDGDDPRCHGVGWQFRERGGSEIVGIFPDVAHLHARLIPRLAECRALFFDGTFWSDEEMTQLGLGTRTARDMGHVPLTGAGGSIDHLTRLTDTEVWFTHINNTNPILRRDSPEHAAVLAAGLRVAYDGLALQF